MMSAMHHYTSIGLDYIWLATGYTAHGLHTAIVMCIAASPLPLVRHEINFLHAVQRPALVGLVQAPDTGGWTCREELADDGQRRVTCEHRSPA